MTGMAKKLKVYGLLMWVQECPPAPNGSKQARCIVAAPSKAAAARAFDTSLHHLNTYGSVTGNKHEIEAAMAQPGVALWTEDRYRPDKAVWKPLRNDMNGER